MKLLNLVIPNLPLAPATAATAVKYSASALAPDTGGTPYPLVGGTDLFGRSVCVPVTIRDASGETYHFQEAIVSVSLDKNIVATQVLGGRGTVKEMVSVGDLSVSLTLAVVSTSPDGDYDGTRTETFDCYPYKGVERVRRLLESDERLDIVSDYLAQFGLCGDECGIVVRSYSAEQTTHLNRQVFTVQAVGDYDYDLFIKE